MNEIVAVETDYGILVETPAQRVAKGTAIANQIKDMIEQQGMYSDIQGKKYVKVDAWVGLGSMDGVFPRERDVIEHEDGSYEAYVELIEKSTGRVIGGASSICGMDENRWRSAQKYARRSMAVTRATGKAFRLHYSWVMCLAGYEPTPLEEMPETNRFVTPVATRKTAKSPQPIVFNGQEEIRLGIADYCASEGMDEAQVDAVLSRMIGKTKAELPNIVLEVKNS